MLDPEFKKKWVEALRSGKYQQGHKVLSQGGMGGPRYCCIGVACQIDERLAGNDAHTALDLIDMDLIGLCAEEQAHLIEMNDGFNGATPSSFASIADWIDANL